jgi:hypothetical protein
VALGLAAVVAAALSIHELLVLALAGLVAMLGRSLWRRRAAPGDPWSHGTGADVMKRIAAPMVGGMVTSTVLTLVVIPAIYLLWRRRELARLETRQQGATSSAART